MEDRDMARAEARAEWNEAAKAYYSWLAAQARAEQAHKDWEAAAARACRAFGDWEDAVAEAEAAKAVHDATETKPE